MTDLEIAHTAYATSELAHHELVNATVAETFLSAVGVASLKELLSEALATFRQHEAGSGFGAGPAERGGLSRGAAGRRLRGVLPPRPRLGG